MECDGRISGLAGWFEAILADDVTLSTAPDQPKTIWRQVFFPVDPTIHVKKGDRVIVEIEAGSGVYGWCVVSASHLFTPIRHSTLFSDPDWATKDNNDLPLQVERLCIELIGRMDRTQIREPERIHISISDEDQDLLEKVQPDLPKIASRIRSALYPF
jgi:hypothetical protein